jgi:hypothetical protein
VPFAVTLAQCRMQVEDAPPGFWPWPDPGAVLVEGVEIESDVPTRFFQTLDRYPREWGSLSWRVQLNRLECGSAATPRFRTFYSGAEWNLRGHGGRWFLTAWARWDGPGPGSGEPSIPRPVGIEGDTVLFRIGPVALRCRVDARDRREIASSLAARDRVEPLPTPGLIVLDDLVQ